MRGFRIRSVRFIGHPVLGNLKLDFFGRDQLPVDTIILAGENGVGKSTVLEVLYGLMSRTIKKVEGAIEIELYNVATQSWCILRYAMQHTTDGRGFVAVTSGNHDYGYIGSSRVQSQFATCAIYSDVSINFNSRDITQISSSTLDADSGSRRSTSNLPTEINQLLVDIKDQDDSDVAAALRANPLMSYSQLEIDERLSRFGRAFSRMFDDTVFDGVTTEGGRKVIYFKKSGVRVPIDGLSSGEKQVVYRGAFLLRDAAATKGTIVFIDEPEISLHPNWQSKILDYYKSLFTDEAGNQTSQIICVTHSPFIIHNPYRCNDKVIVLSRDEDGKVVAKDRPEYYRCDSIAVIDDAFSIPGFVSDTPTVYVEGLTDEKYLNKALHVFGHRSTFAFKQVGYQDERGNDRNSGAKNLAHAFDFLVAHKQAIKNACLFDCDTRRKRERVGNVLAFSLQEYENCVGMKVGIENALVLDGLDISPFYTDKSRVGDYGEKHSNQVFEKMKLCDYLCDQDDETLRVVFANLEATIRELDTFFGE